jgi:2-oxoglutarate ferredoxin oxidoreductase subunit beta
VREHNEAVNSLDFMTPREEITADYAPGQARSVTQHDGSVLRFRKLDADYDPSDRIKAMAYLAERQAAGEIVTGLLHLDEDAHDLHEHLGTVSGPLNRLGDQALVPGAAALEAINSALR